MKLVVELDGEMISRINLLRRRDRQSVSETLTKAITRIFAKHSARNTRPSAGWLSRQPLAGGLSVQPEETMLSPVRKSTTNGKRVGASAEASTSLAFGEPLWKQIVVPGKSEVYLLYWYKSTNTDANAPARKTVASVTCTTICRRKRLNKADDCTAG